MFCRNIYSEDVQSKDDPFGNSSQRDVGSQGVDRPSSQHGQSSFVLQGSKPTPRMAKNARKVSAQKKGKGRRGNKGVRGVRAARGGGVRSESVLPRQLSRSPSPSNQSDELISSVERRGGGTRMSRSGFQRLPARSPSLFDESLSAGDGRTGSSPTLSLEDSSTSGVAHGWRGSVARRGRSALEMMLPRPRSVLLRQSARSPSQSESGVTQRRRGGGGDRQRESILKGSSSPNLLLNESLSGAAQGGRSQTALEMSDGEVNQEEEGRGDILEERSLNLSRDSYPELPDLPPQCYQPTMESYFTPRPKQSGSGKGVSRRNCKKVVNFIDDSDIESNIDDSSGEGNEDSRVMNISTPENDEDSRDMEAETGDDLNDEEASDDEFAKMYGLDDEEL